MFRKKRGFNQVDWSISLGIFLIYIAWFFIIVKPLVLDTGVFSPNSEELKNAFFDLTEKEINLIPIFVLSENILPNQLLELDARFLEGKNYGFITNKPYLIEDDIIYVVDSLSNSTSMYGIVESSNITYDSYNYEYVGILEGNGSINPNSNMTIYFDTEIESIYFKGAKRISNVEYFQNGFLLTNSNFSFTNKYLFGDFVNIFDTYSISDKLVMNSNYLQSRIKKIDKINDINISIEFVLLNYTDYFIDNEDYGTLDSIEDECVVKNSKNIKLVDDNTGVYFVFNKKIDITICNVDDVSVSFNFTNQNIKYVLGFDDGNLSDIPDVFSDYSVDFGVTIKNDYPLISNIINLSNNDFYSRNIQGINGFRLSVYNTTSIETDIRNSNVLNTVWSGSNVTSNIFSIDKIISVQDDYGLIRGMTLNVMVW